MPVWLCYILPSLLPDEKPPMVRIQAPPSGILDPLSDHFLSDYDLLSGRPDKISVILRVCFTGRYQLVEEPLEIPP